MPYAVDNGWLVVSIDSPGVSRDVVREVCRLLAPVRVTVCDARPPHMRPGDYIEVRIGPMDWNPGNSGWCNVNLGDPLLQRYTPQTVHVVAPNPRLIAHEVGHSLFGSGHHADPTNLMYRSPGWTLTVEQIRVGRSNRNFFVAATPDQFTWRWPAGWVVQQAVVTGVKT